MAPFPSITLQVRGRRLAGRLVFTILFAGVILLGAAAGLIFVYSTDLPEIRALEDYRPNVVTELYSDDGQQIGNFALQRRILLTWEQIPPVLKDAITSTEDQHFFEHWGVDLPRVMEAAWRNALRGRIREGASTLTMQLAGGLFLDRSDRSFRRKIQETLLALWLEHRFSKNQILEIYLNRVYLGAGTYGVDAAAHRYFNKSARQTTLYESAAIAGLLKAPTRFNPIRDSDKAATRTAQVLAKMVDAGIVTSSQAMAALSAGTVLSPIKPCVRSPPPHSLP